VWSVLAKRVRIVYRPVFAQAAKVEPGSATRYTLFSRRYLAMRMGRATPLLFEHHGSTAGGS
jgi:hypothetical protein